MPYNYNNNNNNSNEQKQAKYEAKLRMKLRSNSIQQRTQQVCFVYARVPRLLWMNAFSMWCVRNQRNVREFCNSGCFLNNNKIGWTSQLFCVFGYCYGLSSSICLFRFNLYAIRPATVQMSPLLSIVGHLPPDSRLTWTIPILFMSCIKLLLYGSRSNLVLWHWRCMQPTEPQIFQKYRQK